MERVQKLLARAGVASRRASEELISQGRVTINGEKATLGSKADPAVDRIVVNGRPLRLPPEHHYLMLHKPSGYLSSRSDPQGRPTVMDLIPEKLRKLVYPVGRLDSDSDGLLFMFDDGDLAAALTHPRYEVPRTYRVWVSGFVTPTSLSQLRHGVPLDDGLTAPASARIAARGEGYTVLEVTLHEGRKHQVKRMCKAVGHPVRHLTRIASGGVELGSLPPGKWRALSPAEVERLRKSGKQKTEK